MGSFDQLDHPLLATGPSSAVRINRGETYDPDRHAVVDLTLNPGDYLFLRAQLHDRDVFDNDHFSLTVIEGLWDGGTISLPLVGERGMRATVFYTARVLDILPLDRPQASLLSLRRRTCGACARAG